jgi:hypothetical protein
VSERQVEEGKASMEQAYLKYKPPPLGQQDQMAFQTCGAETWDQNSTYRLTPRMGLLPRANETRGVDVGVGVADLLTWTETEEGLCELCADSLSRGQGR